MSTKSTHNSLGLAQFHVVNVAVCRQTIAESKIDYSIDMGRFTIHHGVRDGSPIIIAEHHNQKADELSGVWYDDSHGGGCNHA